MITIARNLLLLALSAPVLGLALPNPRVAEQPKADAESVRYFCRPGFCPPAFRYPPPPGFYVAPAYPYPPIAVVPAAPVLPPPPVCVYSDDYGRPFYAPCQVYYNPSAYQESPVVGAHVVCADQSILACPANMPQGEAFPNLQMIHCEGVTERGQPIKEDLGCTQNI
jgi:hypothetical protein